MNKLKNTILGLILLTIITPATTAYYYPWNWCGDGLDNNNNGHKDCEDYLCVGSPGEDPENTKGRACCLTDDDCKCGIDECQGTEIWGYRNDGFTYPNGTIAYTPNACETEAPDYENATGSWIIVEGLLCNQLVECDNPIKKYDCAEDGQICQSGACVDPGPGPVDVVINEILQKPASDWNGDEAVDQYGDEWIELYNKGATTVDLTGYLLGDSGNPFKYELPSTTEISAGGYLLFYGSETGIRLDDDSDTVYLSLPTFDETYDTDEILDQYAYYTTTADQSHGRYGDGVNNWIGMCVPTPGESNNDGSCPTTTTSTTTTSTTTSTSSSSSTTTTIEETSTTSTSTSTTSTSTSEPSTTTTQPESTTTVPSGGGGGGGVTQTGGSSGPTYSPPKPHPCFNGIQDAGEDGVDCGGTCGKCMTCSDGIQNQGEQDIDCGGPCAACTTTTTTVKKATTTTLASGSGEVGGQGESGQATTTTTLAPIGGPTGAFLVEETEEFKLTLFLLLAVMALLFYKSMTIQYT